MPTVSKQIADQIINNDGYYYDDPRVVKIVQYTNAWGGISYGLIYTGMKLDTYESSRFIINPITIFEIKK